MPATVRARTPSGPIDEFRDLVKALHRAGIEVILDVVYNHTAEGDEAGPTLCFRGLANEVYYILDKDRARYADYSGTGNTLNANQAIVRRLILDSLRYWVAEMHVDGFRFDLASILTETKPAARSKLPRCSGISRSDPVLAGTKLIAEAWDAAGLYQVGSFIGDTWKEWNGRFRDDVRGFVKGDRSTVRLFAQRLLGSPDIYGHRNGSRAKHQLRDLPRRLHAERSGLVQQQAQRSEWRREPRRAGRQSFLELRDRGSERGCRGRDVCAAARSRISWSICCCQSVPRCCRWATRCAAPSTATTMPIARTTM